jgi:peptidoglycan L-alanyl-D-glutamate endopeptidase CwlK
MPEYSERSKKRLVGCHPYLQLILNEAIKYYDLTILEGHRGQEKQNQYYNAGKSKLKYPDSKHNKTPSMACDVVPWHKDEPHIRWDDEKSFFYMAGLIFGIAHRFGIKIRWGRDWDGDKNFNDQTFNDSPHFELI